MPFLFEEHREIGSFWSWTILILLCLAMLAWGLFNYAAIPDRPRAWDAGVLPDVPGKSIYSTVESGATRAAVPKQMVPLPAWTPTNGASRP
jgi:hypothetical protein